MVRGMHGQLMDHVPKPVEEVLKSVTDNVQPLYLLMEEETVQEHRHSQKLAMSTCVQVNKFFEVKSPKYILYLSDKCTILIPFIPKSISYVIFNMCVRISGDIASMENKAHKVT